MYLSGIGFVQLGLDRVSLARHFEFGENGNGLFELLPFGLLVALPLRQRSPLPSRVWRQFSADMEDVANS